ncbi:MAG: peptidylprolyl isomerase [Gammaproteobacteria bacterium]
MKNRPTFTTTRRWILGLALSMLVSGAAVADDVTAKKEKREPRIPTFPIVEMETTAGTMVFELNGRRAPMTVKNFVGYVRSGHFNDTVFHRVIKDFMIQGGGYDEDLAEKPTKKAIPNESGNGLRNNRGTIAMARLNNPHSATAQFYVNLVDNNMLDPNEKRWGYTVFGDLIEGIEVLDAIGAVETGRKGSFPSDVPKEAVIIKSVKLRK